jgi:hypothetical protein
MVPETVVKASQPMPPVARKVQANGLPDGVTILPLNGTTPIVTPTVVSPEEVTAVDATPVLPASQVELPHRARLSKEAGALPPAKRRKPGRPKAGKLDVPRTIASNAPVRDKFIRLGATSAAVVTEPVANVEVLAKPVGPRRMNDIAPRAQPAVSDPGSPAFQNVLPRASKPATKSDKPPARSHARPHKVGIAPLHYGAVVAFSLRARARPRLVALALLGSLSLGVASAYGIYILLTSGVGFLAQSLTHSTQRLGAEAALLALIYYVGRSLGQTAIMYGIAREADQRPVTLSRQFGVAINTFARRIRLDISFGFGEACLIACGVVLFVTGGQTWPINADLQVGIIFGVYLVLLYLISALAISRGLAGVNLTLTTHKAGTAAKIGWQLFSHRVELIGPRFGALLMELILALPLVALGVALVVSAPAPYHLLVALGAGLLAWLTGAMLGVGTAAWWSMLYRQLVLTDRPGAAVALLSTRQPENARATPLIFVVALSTLLVAATLVLPWISLR